MNLQQKKYNLEERLANPPRSPGSKLEFVVKIARARILTGQRESEEQYKATRRLHKIAYDPADTEQMEKIVAEFIRLQELLVEPIENVREIRLIIDYLTNNKKEAFRILKSLYRSLFSVGEEWVDLANLVEGTVKTTFTDLENKLKTYEKGSEKYQYLLPRLREYLLEQGEKVRDSGEITMALSSTDEKIRSFGEEASNELAHKEFEKQSYQLFQAFLKIAELEGTTKLATDFAGRPLADGPALPSETLSPYSMPHNNYNAEETLKRKELEEKVKKLKEMSNKYKETQNKNI